MGNYVELTLVIGTAHVSSNNSLMMGTVYWLTFPYFATVQKVYYDNSVTEPLDPICKSCSHLGPAQFQAKS